MVLQYTGDIRSLFFIRDNFEIETLGIRSIDHGDKIFLMSATMECKVEGINFLLAYLSYCLG